jgi:hypothetical protein
VPSGVFDSEVRPQQKTGEICGLDLVAAAVAGCERLSWVSGLWLSLE